MKYITVTEASKKWNINERRVRALLKEKRIEGAILDGHKYLIPENYRKTALKYMRIGSFLFLFIYSGIVREFRETQLKKKEVDKKKML